MTVEELIKELQKVRKDKVVVLGDFSGPLDYAASVTDGIRTYDTTDEDAVLISVNEGE